jgi:hypothetical protein
LKDKNTETGRADVDPDNMLPASAFENQNLEGEGLNVIG